MGCFQAKVRHERSRTLSSRKEKKNPWMADSGRDENFKRTFRVSDYHRAGRLREGGTDLGAFLFCRSQARRFNCKVNAVIRRKTKDWYAIKTMHKRQVLSKTSGLEMLFNERNLLAETSSPYIINMHHCFQGFNMREAFVLRNLIRRPGRCRFLLHRYGSCSGR